MITSDFHMHTEFSSDSETPVRDMIEASIQKGLKTICITDHEDYDYPMEEGFAIEDHEKYIHTILEFREEYKDRIDIRVGIEIGLQPHLGEYFHGLISKYPFDFVIGSLHLVKGYDPYYGEIFEEMTDEEVYRQAFVETAECIRAIPDFDVLGHIDYVVRYGRHQAKEYSYERFRDEIDEILRSVIEAGKGIELNSSGLKYGLGFCHPHPDILKRYRELGGEILTIGADGHKPEHIAYDFAKAEEVLKACGFKYYTEFQARKPIFKQIR